MKYHICGVFLISSCLSLSRNLMDSKSCTGCNSELTSRIYINQAGRITRNSADMLHVSMGREDLLRAHIYRTLLTGVPLILAASHCHCHVCRWGDGAGEFGDLSAECSEGPGLEPWQPDSEPVLSPSVRPWGGRLRNTVHQKRPVNRQMKEEVCEHAKVLLWTETCFSCFLCVSAKSYHELPGRLAKGWFMRICSTLPAG